MKKRVNKKADLSINVIIVAIIAIVVLVVILFIFGGQTKKAGSSFSTISDEAGKKAQDATKQFGDLFGDKKQEQLPASPTTPAPTATPAAPPPASTPSASPTPSH